MSTMSMRKRTEHLQKPISSLINQSLEAIDGIFDNLPTTHPAKGPYRLFSKAEKVKGNAVLGLGNQASDYAE